MITAKKTFILGITLLLLVGAISVGNYLQSQQKSSLYTTIFPGVSLDDIYSFSLEQNGVGVLLKKQVDGSWMVQHLNGSSTLYRADSVKALSLIDKILVTKRERVVTTNNALYPDFDLMPQKAVFVKVFNATNKEIATFMVGKKAQNWRNTYIVLSNNPEVIEASGSISYVFKPNIKDWRITTIPLFDANTLAQISISGDSLSAPLLLHKTDNGWVQGATSLSLKPVAAAPLNEFLKGLNLFTVAHWVEDTPLDSITRFASPSIKLVFTDTSGIQNTLVVGNRKIDSPQFYIESNMALNVALIYNAQYEGIMHSISQIKK